MSLNQLLKKNGTLFLDTHSIKTDNLLIKMVNNDYIRFVLPSFGQGSEVLQSDGKGGLKWTANDSNISTVFCVLNDTTTVFVNELVLTPYFAPLRQGNFELNNNSKVLLRHSMIYKWVNTELVPDFYVNVCVNGIIISSDKYGLTDSPDSWNKIGDTMILDVNASDIISIKLGKTDSSSTSFIIQKNSFFSIESL